MNLAHRFTEAVTRAAVTGRNSFGETTYAAKTKIKARVQRRSMNVIGNDGVELQSDTQLFTATKLTLDDRIWLSEDSTSDNDKARKPIAVQEHRDLAGRVVYYLAFF